MANNFNFPVKQLAFIVPINEVFQNADGSFNIPSIYYDGGSLRVIKDNLLHDEKTDQYYRVAFNSDCKLLTFIDVTIECRRIKDLNEQASEYRNQIARGEYDDLVDNIYNRKKIKSILNECMRYSYSIQKTFYVAFCDIDHFKIMNDTYGHHSGDKVLQEYGNILKQRASEYGFYPGRYGGDEFLIVFGPNNSMESVLEALEKIRKDINDLSFNVEEIKDRKVKFTAPVSIGVRACSPGIYSIPDIITGADTAMYSSKARGGNAISIYNEVTSVVEPYIHNPKREK